MHFKSALLRHTEVLTPNPFIHAKQTFRFPSTLSCCLMNINSWSNIVNSEAKNKILYEFGTDNQE